MSYLLCKNCGHRFELEEGYNPGDFPWKCECGGTLIYINESTGHTEDELFF